MPDPKRGPRERAWSTSTVWSDLLQVSTARSKINRTPVVLRSRRLSTGRCPLLDPDRPSFRPRASTGSSRCRRCSSSRWPRPEKWCPCLERTTAASLISSGENPYPAGVRGSLCLISGRADTAGQFVFDQGAPPRRFSGGPFVARIPGDRAGDPMGELLLLVVLLEMTRRRSEGRVGSAAIDDAVFLTWPSPRPQGAQPRGAVSPTYALRLPSSRR